MAITINFLAYEPLEIATEEPEETPKQNGRRVVCKLTVSGAAGGLVNIGRLGLQTLRGVIPGISAAAITTYSEANGTITIPSTDGVYTFEAFGTAAGTIENYDPNLIQ